MRFRKLTALALAAGLVLAACGGDDESSADTTAAGGGSATTAASGDLPAFEPLKADTLTIITSLPAPGFWNGGDTVDAITDGFEYDLVKKIQADLGLANIEFRNVSFDALVAGQESDYDVAFSQVTIRPAREEVVDFSVPYFSSDQGVLVQAGTTVATLADAKGLLWGVQTGTTGESFVNETVQPDQDPQVFPDLASAFTALRAGQIDAVMMDTAIIVGEAESSGGALEVAGQFKTGENYGAILPTGSPNKAAIDALLERYAADGTLNGLTAKYLGFDPSAIPVIPAS